MLPRSWMYCPVTGMGSMHHVSGACLSLIMTSAAAWLLKALPLSVCYAGWEPPAGLPEEPCVEALFVCRCAQVTGASCRCQLFNPAASQG
jgi:hypothetical protein